MNHRPFEEMLLSDTPLLVEQKRELNNHLRDCEQCRQLETGLAGVEHLFRASAQMAPAEGFVTRWQARLVEQRLRQQQRLSWLLFGITGGIALVLLVLLGFQAWASLQSPQYMLLLKAYALSAVVAIVGGVRAILTIAQRILFASPLLWVMTFTGITSFLSVLWIVMYRQLTMARRISI